MAPLAANLVANLVALLVRAAPAEHTRQKVIMGSVASVFSPVESRTVRSKSLGASASRATRVARLAEGTVMTQATDPKALEPGQREMLRKKLLEERGKLSARHSSELRASEGLRSEVEDEGDAASRANGEDALVSLAEVDHQRLREIERALAKFALGTYGLDEETGEPIEFARLAIIPWARHAARTEETRQR